MTKIYLSGPITGLSFDDVLRNFSNAESELKEQGYEVVNPINNGLNESHTWEDHMKADIKLLLDCDEIYMLKGWKDSRGARLECAIALELDLEITYEK